MNINFYKVPIAERVAMAEKLAEKLEGYLGADGAVIFDNELEFLIYLLNDFVVEAKEDDK